MAGPRQKVFPFDSVLGNEFVGLHLSLSREGTLLGLVAGQQGASQRKKSVNLPSGSRTPVSAPLLPCLSMFSFSKATKFATLTSPSFLCEEGVMHLELQLIRCPFCLSEDFPWLVVWPAT